MKTFSVITETGIELAKGVINHENAILITWRGDIGVCAYEIPELKDAFKIAPTAYYINTYISEASVNDYNVDYSGNSQWTGGHKSPGKLPEIKNSVPSPDEQISILDCVD